MSFKPVIFLAYANDKVDHALFLRNLSLEMHGIRKALADAMSKGLCDIVERSSTSVSDILDVFSDPVYKDRISIFHYGGHANEYSLLLEAQDGSKQLTNKEGLVAFFARQVNLKLIFINGCCSEQQTNELIKAGIPSVIGTTTTINDEVATTLSIRFYESLSTGSSISKAWADATDEVKILKGSSNTRALFWAGKEDNTNRFPWVIQFRPGAEAIKEWNLPDISGNPLYGLPDIPATFNLPESPFLYLNRYERKHAEVFFGRSYFIRALFSNITDKEAPPIILLYGQSGVGKSSLLEAGLQPRLESGYTILYLRRVDSLGLSETVLQGLLKLNGFDTATEIKLENETSGIVQNLELLAAAIQDEFKSDLRILIEKIQKNELKTHQGISRGNPITPTSIIEAWKYTEDKNGRPLLIILDQVEEAYTRPNTILKNEVNQLFSDLKSLFGNPILQPKGKIILSFRKEYHPEIEEYCKKYELPRSKVFIEHIDKADILDIFKGISSTAKLQARYNIKIEDGLPEIIASDLMSDQDAPIAPMLQILLTKLWLKASATNPQAPVFSHTLYQELKTEGLAMDEFLHNQLINIKAKHPELFQSGFVLDVLSFYCTANSTSAAKSLQELHNQFPFCKADADTVLAACKELFLITDLGGDKKLSMLAHDTLAKSVVKAQQLSALRLQQAKRVLNSRIEAIRAGSDMATLDTWDLKLIESIQNFLPAYSDEIKNLIKSSRISEHKKERERKIFAYTRRILGAVTFIAAIVIGVLYSRSNKHMRESEINHLATASAMHVNTDPTLSLQEAMAGYAYKDSLSAAAIQRSLIHSFYNSIDNHRPWYKIWYSSPPNQTRIFKKLVVSKDGNVILPIGYSDTIAIYNKEGKKTAALNTDTNSVFFQNAWVVKDSFIITQDEMQKVSVWDVTGKKIKDWKLKAVIISIDYSPFLNQFVISRFTDLPDKGIVSVVDIYGAHEHVIDSVFANEAKFLPDQKTILVNKYPNTLIEYDETGKNTSVFKKSAIEIDKVIYSHHHKIKALKYLGAYTPSTVFYNDKNQKIELPAEIDNLNQYFENVEFNPSENLALIKTQGQAAILYNFQSKTGISISHDLPITVLKFSVSGDKIISGASDNIIKIWDLEGHILHTLIGHTGDIADVHYYENESKVISLSADGSIRAWILNPYSSLYLIGHRGGVSTIASSPDVSKLVSCGYRDSTLKIWDIISGNQLDQKKFDEFIPQYAQFLNEHTIIGTMYEKLLLYHVNTKKLQYLPGHASRILSYKLMQNFIVSYDEESLIVWNKAGTLLKNIKLSYTLTSSHGNTLPPTLQGLAICDLSNSIAIANTEGTIFIIQPQGSMLDTLQGHTSAISYLNFNNSGDRLVSISKDGSGNVWDLQSKPALQYPLGKLRCSDEKACKYNTANFSQDGNFLLTTSTDRVVRILDDLGNFITDLNGHMDDVLDAFFVPHNHFVYTYSMDKTVRLWDLNGTELAVYRHAGNISHAIIDLSLQRIFTSSSQSDTIRGFYTPSGAYKWLKENKVIDGLKK